MVSTGFPGVYFREGAGRKRLQSDGQKDKCFCIRYRINGRWHYETVGWESEGVSVEKAVAMRSNRLAHPPQVACPADQPRNEYVMQRKNAGRVGVYYRFGKNRVDSTGKPDRCYDILYKKDGKLVYEKIGWTSEGYSIEDAVAIRGARVKALRHPELCPDESERISGATLEAVWEVFQRRWLPTLKRQQGIIGNYTLHIAPHFGNRVVASIESGEIEDYRNMLLTRTSPATGRPLTPGSVKIIIADLRRLINKGISWGMIKNKGNVAAKIRIADADRKRERYLTPEEAEKLLDCLQHVSCTLYYIVMIGLYTGMRLSEIVSLKWQDINLSPGILYLSGKTGRRPAYIPEELKSLIARLKPKKASDLLFVTRNNTPLNFKKVSDRFKKVIDALGFNNGVTDSTQKVVFHTLRHTFCSWLAIKGVPLYTIGKLVGHTSPEMTQRYAKLSPDSHKDALKHIGGMLKGT